MENNILLSEIGERCGDVSLQCSDIAGYLNQLNANIQGDVSRLIDLRQVMAALSRTQAENSNAARHLQDTSLSAEDIIGQCRAAIAESLDHVTSLVQRVTGLESRLRDFLPIIETVGGISEQLREIARKTRMLGLNASIEAARGGEATRSFTVVADEIRFLAERADHSAASVGEQLGELDKRARALIGGVEENIRQGQSTGIHIDELRTAMDRIGGLVTAFRARSSDIADSTAEASHDVRQLSQGLDHFSTASMEHARQLDEVVERVDRLEGYANDMFNSAAHAGLESRNSRFIALGLEGAAEVVRAIEDGLARGLLGRAALFDTDYQPLPGTDPVQYRNRFVPFADTAIRPLLDAQTARDQAIVGCCLIDRNGFLPTHISEKSQPQRQGQRKWNLENARNRQIFMDSQTRRALDDEGDFFLYSYRQDFGDGHYRALRSVFVPLRFDGQRWGLYELGYLI